MGHFLASCAILATNEIDRHLCRVRNFEVVVSKTDWYRNADWNAEIESAFFIRLKRARDKSQYLRIQASYLCNAHPRVALQLLDQYFLLEDHFDLAQAKVHEAEALAALGEIDAALAACGEALQRERQFPNYKTNAYLNFVLLVLKARKANLYTTALEVLDEFRERPIFPVDRYRAHSARALILQELGRAAEARSSGKLALAAAAESQSGFLHHQNLGLVQSVEDEFGTRIAAVASSPESHSH
jgi:tetratricopeptide (TPR) repeat protein